MTAPPATEYRDMSLQVAADTLGSIKEMGHSRPSSWLWPTDAIPAVRLWVPNAGYGRGPSCSVIVTVLPGATMFPARGD